MTYRFFGVGFASVLMTVACGDTTLTTIDTSDSGSDATTGDTSEDGSITLGWEAPRPPAAVSWPFDPPFINGGEVVLGVSGQIVVKRVPEGATVEIYRSFKGQGPGSCDFVGGLCAGIVEPELHATGEAVLGVNALSGLPEVSATINVGAGFDAPAEVAWQALVYAPGQEGVATWTDVLVRHASVSPEETEVPFDKVTRELGVESSYTNANGHQGGMAWVDVNGDYWADLLIANGTTYPNYLYINDGRGRFTDYGGTTHNELAKPDPAGLACGDAANRDLETGEVKYADFDNDGDFDILLVSDHPDLALSFIPMDYCGGPNLLFMNNGDGTFTESGEGSGVVDPRGWRNSAAAIADYDRDGCADVYMVNWAMAVTTPLENIGNNHDRLLKGNCDGTFTDVTEASGADGLGRDGLVAFWWDSDFDRFPDLYVGNNSDIDSPPEFDPDDVYFKNMGDGTFEDWTGTTPGLGDDARAAMGIDIGDINADGYWDLYITDVWELLPNPQGNPLYMGLPGGLLTDNVCADAGVCFGHNSWPANFEDFNHDGWIDLWVGSSRAETHEKLFLNKGAADPGVFEPHQQEGWFGNVSKAGSTTDFDGDGDIDIFLWTEGDTSDLYRNNMDVDRNWLQLRLIGANADMIPGDGQSYRTTTMAVGTVARIQPTGQNPLMMRRVTGGDSAHSHRDLTLHFGLAQETSATVELAWPSGLDETIHVDDVNRFYLVRENEGVVSHAFESPMATWDDATGTMAVSTSSNYGGRAMISVLEAAGIETCNDGELVYDVRTVSYVSASEPCSTDDEACDFVVGPCELDARPSHITLATSWGDTLQIPVVLATAP